MTIDPHKLCGYKRSQLGFFFEILVFPTKGPHCKFLVGAFLEKRVDYSHGFSSVFFKLKKKFDTPEVTKIVLPQKFF